MTDLRRLTYSENEAARTEAASRTAGTKPEPGDFTSESASEYPQWMTITVAVVVAFALLAAFVPSAIHIQDAAFRVAIEAIDHQSSAVTISYFTVALAESGIVAFSLALAVLKTGKTSWIFLWTGILMSLLIAMAGNIEQAKPYDVLSWAMALVPPLLAVFLSHVLKELLLNAIRNNRAANLAYETALTAYETALTNAEQAPGYALNWHNSLRDAIEFANSHGPGSGKRKRIMPNMTATDWATAVARELNAGSELTSEIKRVSKRPERKAKVPAKMPVQNEAGEHVAECPTCDWVSERTYETSAKAARAYNGHCGGAGHVANLEALQPVAHTNGNGAKS